jgi:hypothetical protein
MRSTLASLGAVLLLGIAAGALLEQARAHENLRVEDDIKYMPSAEFLRAASLGHESFVADLLWFRVIQYYGEWRGGDHGIDFFENLVDTVVELDPKFEDAYRFAAQVMAEDMGAPEKAIALLERGMQENPKSWWLPFEAGFIEYTVHMDDAKAFVWFQKAAAVPGASDFARRFAAFVGGRAGHLEVSYELWKYIARTTDNDDLRQRAIEYVGELEEALYRGGPVPDWTTRRRVIQMDS